MFNIKITMKNNKTKYYEAIRIIEDDVETINIIDKKGLVCKILQNDVKMILCKITLERSDV